MQPLDKTLSTRRHFLASNVMNLSAIALPFLLQQQTRAEPSKPDLTGEHFDLEPKSLDHEPRAKAMISLWMQGGPSHIDLFTCHEIQAQNHILVRDNDWLAARWRKNIVGGHH